MTNPRKRASKHFCAMGLLSSCSALVQAAAGLRSPGPLLQCACHLVNKRKKSKHHPCIPCKPGNRAQGSPSGCLRGQVGCQGSMSLSPSPIPPRRGATTNPISKAEPPAPGEAWLARALGSLAFGELNQRPVQQNTQEPNGLTGCR